MLDVSISSRFVRERESHADEKRWGIDAVLKMGGLLILSNAWYRCCSTGNTKPNCWPRRWLYGCITYWSAMVRIA